VVPDEERLAGFGEEAGGEEKADAAEREGGRRKRVSGRTKRGRRGRWTHKGTKAAMTNSSQRRDGQATVRRTVTVKKERWSVSKGEK